MATYVWRGDAQAVSQVTTITPSNVEIGDTFTVTINNKDITVTATAATVANVVDLLVLAIGGNAMNAPEWDEVAASTGTDDDGVSTHVILTGQIDGKPFTATASAADASSYDMTITETQAAADGQNEKQQIRLADGVSGGTFTISYGGVASAAIAWNASAATVETAIEGIAGVGAGQATTTGTGPWVVEFTGTFAQTNAFLMVGDGTNLTGTLAITATEITQGRTGQNSQWTVTPNGTGSFAFFVFTNPDTADPEVYRLNTGWLDPTDSAATVQAAIEALSHIGTGNVAVSKSAAGVFTVEFIAVLATVDVELQEGTGTTVPTLTETQVSDATVVAEVQDVAVPIATGGTFTLSFDGQTTAGIAYDASAATVEAALELLSTIGSGNIDLTESATPGFTTYQCTFAGTLTGVDQNLITGSGASLTGATVYSDVTQEMQLPTNEAQTVQYDNTPSGGTFKLTYDGQEFASGVAYNASAATLETALELLSTIDAVAVTGPAGGPWTVEFQGTLAATDVDLMTADSSATTGADTQAMAVSTTTSATGPEHFNNVDNWDLGSVPVDGSTIVYEHSARDCLYSLSQSAITPAAIFVRQSYSGRIGLPPDTGLYVEYRDQYLALGNSGDAQAITVTIGEGNGTGSSRIKLDTGDAQTELIVMNTGTAEGDVSTLLWKGTAATNVVRVYKGSVGIAVYAGESAVIEDMEVGYRNDQDGDSEVICGRDVDLDDIEQSGGNLEIGGVSADAIETFIQTEGTSVINGTDGVDSITIRGGTCYYNSTGTLGGNPIVSGDGVLDFSQDMRTKDVTNPIEVYGEESDVIDSFQVVTGLIVDYNETSRIPSLGRNIRVTRGTPA